MSFLMAIAYNSYHTNTIIALQAGLLPRDILKKIPDSTRFNWKKKDISKIFGFDDPRVFSQNIEIIKDLFRHKKILKVTKTLLYVNQFLRSTFNKIKNHKKYLADAKKEIIHLVDQFISSMSSFTDPQKTKKKVLKWLGITVHQFMYWKSNIKSCPSSLIDLCRSKHPAQLTIDEVKIIPKYVKNPDFIAWSLTSIYLQILNDNAAFFAISTFFKYVRKLGLPKKFKSFKTRKEGIRASRPGEIIHADITEYRLTCGRKVYIYHFADNYSRFPFRCMASFEKLPEITLQNLECVIADYPNLFQERFTLLVDDGVENKGALREFASKNRQLVLLLIAMKDIMVSNSMIEARNKSLKIEYLRDREFATLESLQKALNEYLEDFRNRPQKSLEGSTPHAVLLKEDIPDNKRYKDKMAAARLERIAENRKFDCNNCSTEAIAD
jgi:hypothetical protein